MYKANLNNPPTPHEMALIQAVERLPVEDVRYVLYRLVLEERVTLPEIEEIRRFRVEEVASLKRMLALFAGGTPPSERTQRKKETRPRTLSPEVREQRRVHGQFVGLLRQVPEMERPRFLQIYRDDSPIAAIEAIKKFRLREKAKREGEKRQKQIAKDSGVSE